MKKKTFIVENEKNHLFNNNFFFNSEEMLLKTG